MGMPTAVVICSSCGTTLTEEDEKETIVIAFFHSWQSLNDRYERKRMYETRMQHYYLQMKFSGGQSACKA